VATKAFSLTDYSVAVLPRGLEPILEQPLKLSKMLAINASKHFHVLQWQLERSGFESKVSGRVRQHEPKVDMDKVSFSI
jgi:hypothetical protein